MTMITPSYLGETIEYSSLHACRSTLEDPTASCSSSRLRMRSRRDGLDGEIVPRPQTPYTPPCRTDVLADPKAVAPARAVWAVGAAL